MATGRLPDPNSSPLTAKGDLYTYSTVPAKLAVGNNGETLVADSSQSTGLRWNPIAANLANPVINGGMDIWQRGTSFAGTSSLIYTADRWQLWRTALVTGMTVSRQATSDTTNLPNIQYCARVQRDSGNTGTQDIKFTYDFETVNSIPFAGKSITISFYARKGANYTNASGVYLEVLSGTGTDQRIINGYTGQSSVGGAYNNVTTTWQRFVITGTVPSNSTQLGLGFYYVAPSGTAGANDYFEVTGVQIDVGTYTAATAPTFRRSGGTLAGELAACQRYYYRNTATTAYSNFGIGWANSTTSLRVLLPLPVTMRTQPTSVEYSTLAGYDGAIYAATNVGFAENNSQTPSVVITTTGLTQYRTYSLIANNSTTAYIAVSAEL